MPQPFDLSPDAPWKQRFRAERLRDAAVAPAQPDRVLAVGVFASATPQLYAAEQGQPPRLLFEQDGQVSEAWIGPDGGEVVFLRDTQGDELGHLWEVGFAGGEPRDLTPELRPYTLRGLGFSRDGGSLALMAVNEEGFQLYVLERDAAGEWRAPRLVARHAEETWDAQLSADGRLVACKSTARAGGLRQYSLLVYRTGDGGLAGELWDGPGSSVEGACFAPRSGDPRLLASATRGDLRRPLIWNVLEGVREELELPEVEGDVLPQDWSPDGARVLLAQVHRAEQQLFTYDLAARRLERIAHPSGTWFWPWYSRVQWAADGQIYSVFSNSATPPALVALAPERGELRTVVGSGEAPPSRLWRSVSFPSSDGTLLQGWLATPEGQGPFPTILEAHGGPHVVTTDTFAPWSQVWLDHGFAWLSVNYRGSTTFGQAFKEQIWGDVGHWELEDLVAARAWLVGEGVARPEAVVLHGASYGGYLTLWGLCRRPDLWAAGLAFVAIADWLANYEDAIEALRTAFAAWHRGTPDDRRDAYVASSPITYAEQIQAPLLVIQGLHDSRTPPRQMRLFEQRLRDLGKPIEVIWFDQGHGIPSTDQAIEFHERMLKFVEKLGFMG